LFENCVQNRAKVCNGADRRGDGAEDRRGLAQEQEEKIEGQTVMEVFDDQCF
jgi:hypothetical protein